MSEPNEKEKAWTQGADGIYRNANGKLYERPWIDGKRTFRTLKTKNLKHAKEELHRRRSGFKPEAKADIIIVGDVLRRYRDDGFPDKQKAQRPKLMAELEAINVETQLKWWHRW